MFLKICANTNLNDAALAAELGADAVGFVFAPSKRIVTVDQVAARMVPALESTGGMAVRTVRMTDWLSPVIDTRSAVA